MGMYDYVTDVPEVTCSCGAEVTGWQTKDFSRQLVEIPYWEVDNFYTMCDSCKAWHEFNREVPAPPRPEVPITNYKRKEVPKNVRPD